MPNKVISVRLAIVGVGKITAFYFQQIVIIRAQREREEGGGRFRTDPRPSSSPPASILGWPGTRSLSF